MDCKMRSLFVEVFVAYLIQSLPITTLSNMEQWTITIHLYANDSIEEQTSTYAPRKLIQHTCGLVNIAYIIKEI